MANKFATGKYALGICDVCGFQYKLSTLKETFENDKPTGLLACKECWNADHPQNQLGKYPVVDAEALRNPRPDTGLEASRDLTWWVPPVEDENPT